MKPLAIFALLAVTGCDQFMTGDPIKDCTAAHKGVIAAQLAYTAAQSIASANPKLEWLQHAADLALTALSTAQLNETLNCPPV